MTKDTDPSIEEPSRPHPALQRLNVLIGTWDMKGHTLNAKEDNITGWNTFEWLPGGFFLKSSGEINFKGAIIQSTEIIGYDPVTDTFPSNVYSNMDGKVLPYSWNIQGNIVIHSDLTSQYTGTLSEDGKTLTGGWRSNAGEQPSDENSYDAIMWRR
jgi:hypothetical protein